MNYMAEKLPCCSLLHCFHLFEECPIPSGPFGEDQDQDLQLLVPRRSKIAKFHKIILYTEGYQALDTEVAERH